MPASTAARIASTASRMSPSGERVVARAARRRGSARAASGRRSPRRTSTLAVDLARRRARPRARARPRSRRERSSSSPSTIGLSTVRQRVGRNAFESPGTMRADCAPCCSGSLAALAARRRPRRRRRARVAAVPGDRARRPDRPRPRRRPDRRAGTRRGRARVRTSRFGRLRGHDVDGRPGRRSASAPSVDAAVSSRARRRRRGSRVSIDGRDSPRAPCAKFVAKFAHSIDRPARDARLVGFDATGPLIAPRQPGVAVDATADARRDPRALARRRRARRSTLPTQRRRAAAHRRELRPA